MQKSKKARLEARGWRFGTATAFLGVEEPSEEELVTRFPSRPRPSKTPRHAVKAARKRAR
jgi:hypothetical protein